MRFETPDPGHRSKAVYSPRHGVVEEAGEDSQASEVKAEIEGALRRIGAPGAAVRQPGAAVRQPGRHRARRPRAVRSADPGRGRRRAPHADRGPPAELDG